MDVDAFKKAEIVKFVEAHMEEWPEIYMRPHPAKQYEFFATCVQARWEGWLMARSKSPQTREWPEERTPFDTLPDNYEVG